jgi:hypothetical protein
MVDQKRTHTGPSILNMRITPHRISPVGDDKDSPAQGLVF